jgi:hypothetical protein
MFQETAFFIIIAMKTSNHRYIISWNISMFTFLSSTQ